MTTTTGPTIKVKAHYVYKPSDPALQAVFGTGRPTYVDGIIGWSNKATRSTNGLVVLETERGMYTDQPHRDAVLTANIANHYGMRLYTTRPVATDEERKLLAAAANAGFAIVEIVG